MPRYIDADKADVEEISCYYGSNCYIEDVQEWLNEQPTADVVEVVHERWVFKLSKYEADECVCSLCRQTMTTERGVRMNYCPNCGAKMDLKEGDG